MDSSLVAVLGLGFLLGLRHAMDADHVATVSTLVSQHRSVLFSCLLGTFWGLGHTTALLAAGTVMIVFNFTISPVVEHALEGAVAVLLVALGAYVVLRSLGSLAPHRHEHSHDGERHSHVHAHLRSHGHAHLIAFGRRPFLIGMLHGLAGSAALMLLVLGTIRSPAAAVLYLVVFGIGSTGGMLVLSGLIGVPFAFTARGSTALHGVVQMLAGLTSAGLGVTLLMT